jgi:putative tricarboxylic transport membrane protein
MAGMTYGPEFFPTLIGIGFCLCGLSLLLSGLLAQRGAERVPLVTLPAWFSDRLAVLRAVGVVAAVAAYALFVGMLGFHLTVFLITAALLLMLDAPRLITAVISVALPLVLHYGFSIILRVPLPRGPFEQFFF